MKRGVVSLIVVLFCILSFSSAFGENCSVTAWRVTCHPYSFSIDGRDVFYQLPQGEVPSEGWPVVIDFLPYGYHASMAWSASRFDRSGYNHLLTVKALLDNGYAVLMPETNPAYLAPHWETNMPQYVNAVIGDRFTEVPAPDHVFLTEYLFPVLDSSPLIDGSCKFAMGLSSGGYMASRMGVSYKDEGFKAITISAASYAAWAGTWKPVPIPEAPELAGHPPTLFMHGIYDTLVPVSTMLEYAEKLKEITEVRIVTGSYGHRWADDAPYAVTEWFNQFR